MPDLAGALISVAMIVVGIVVYLQVDGHYTFRNGAPYSRWLPRWLGTLPLGIGLILAAIFYPAIPQLVVGIAGLVVIGLLIKVAFNNSRFWITKQNKYYRQRQILMIADKLNSIDPDRVETYQGHAENWLTQLRKPIPIWDSDNRTLAECLFDMNILAEAI